MSNDSFKFTEFKKIEQLLDKFFYVGYYNEKLIEESNLRIEERKRETFEVMTETGFQMFFGYLGFFYESKLVFSLYHSCFSEWRHIRKDSDFYLEVDYELLQKAWNKVSILEEQVKKEILQQQKKKSSILDELK